jgi:hypothetical protein
MAIDLFCYSDVPQDDVEITLKSLSMEYPEIFSEKFLISKIREPSAVGKEIALEYGLHAESFFMVRLNHKDTPSLVVPVAGLIKNAFGERKVIVLHENEHLM